MALSATRKFPVVLTMTASIVTTSIAATSLLALGGCSTQSAQPVASVTALPLDDTAFPEFDRIAIETEADIFALDDDAKHFAHAAVADIDDPWEQMESLVHRIFDRAEFNLLYMASANTTATQTFHNRAANCLSMSIMTYAMANEVGFLARFKDIQIPEYWTRREGQNVLSDHINLVLIPKIPPNEIRILNTAMAVDFDPQAARSPFPNFVISKNTVVAMFYNNKGADALMAGDTNRAYAYFRAATDVDPLFDSVWVNLGSLYRRNGLMDLAEASLKQALAVSPDNLSAWGNLAQLYEHTGRTEAAKSILARVQAERADNPYYHFILGEQAFDEGHYQQALAHYDNALSLDNTKHEIFYGLAKTWLALGDQAKSTRYLTQAKRKSRSAQDQERYQGKLDVVAAAAGPQ